MNDAGKGFARLVDVERLGREPVNFDIRVSETERRQLAERLGILSLANVSAKGALKRRDDGRIVLSAKLEADALQACVVTLEPVAERIEEEVQLVYTFDKKDLEVEELDKVVGMDEEDPPELIENGKIDLADMISEQIALALDPYPRRDDLIDEKSGIDAVDTADKAREVHRPFANLKDLMQKK